MIISLIYMPCTIIPQMIKSYKIITHAIILHIIIASKIAIIFSISGHTLEHILWVKIDKE